MYKPKMPRSNVQTVRDSQGGSAIVWNAKSIKQTAKPAAKPAADVWALVPMNRATAAEFKAYNI